MGQAASIGSAALSAFGSIMSGRAQSRNLANEAQMYDSQAKGVDLQAVQSSERRREDRRAALSALEASRAARGLSLDTPSAVAIEREITRQSIREEGVDRLGFMNQAAGLRATARARRRGASTANAMGYIQAGQTLMSSAGDLASLGSTSITSKLPGSDKSAQKKAWSL